MQQRTRAIGPPSSGEENRPESCAMKIEVLYFDGCRITMQLSNE